MNHTEFTGEDITFLESQADNGKTATLDSSAAYVRNLDHNIKQQYEGIYQRLIDGKFHLCYHCGNDVFVMVRDVHKLFKTFKAGKKAPVEPEATETEVPLPKSAPSQKKGKK